MSDFEGSPTGAEVLRLMGEGFVDVMIRRLEAQHPDVASDVEDAAAAAVMKLVARSTDGRPPIEDVAGYLYTATRNGVYDAHKRQQRLSEYDPELHDDAELAADHDLLQKDAYRTLQRLVRRWPNRNVREYMLLYLDSLYYGEPLTRADAAAQLSDIFGGEEVAVGSIGTWKRRGITQLAEDYEAQRRTDAAADNERND